MEDKTLIFECEKYGKEIDPFVIKKDYNGLKDYLTKVENIVSSCNSSEYATIFYYLGTGYGELSDYQRKIAESTIDSLSDEYRKKALSYMRKSLALLEENDNNKTLLLCAYTNYANSLDSCGRVIEALRIYRKVINLYSEFGMAVGNYGRALKFYANEVNDSGHYIELHRYAYQAIKKALSIQDSNMHEDAISAFEKMAKEYENSQHIKFLKQPIIFKKYCLGNKVERNYRKWCLENHLFLNPLNDLIEQESAFAHDPLTITQYTEYVGNDIDENEAPPKWFSMLNQLKEEFIYARYLCYESSKETENLHYADKNVKLTLSSCDYVKYSIRLEQLKSAYKSLFSIFDQIGFAINEFWNLGFSEREAKAANVFKRKEDLKDNVALLALYWAYCEFYEKFGDSEEASEKDLKTLRNAIEHKFVKVHEHLEVQELQLEKDSFYHISEENLKKYTLRLLELSREFIMEFVYAIGIEESRKKRGEEQAIQMNLTDFDDKWKL